MNIKGYLIAEEGPLSGLVIRLEDGSEWIIGRDPESSFQVLEDPMVSRKHLICRLTDEGFVVENLSATNPAAINGNPVLEPTLLEEGDVLQVGSTLFKFTEEDPAGGSQEAGNEISHPTILEEESPLDSLSLLESSSARWIIKVISGPNTGAEFPLETSQTYIIGKDPQLSDIIFQDLSVSRQHCKITVSEDGEVLIEDLSSKNGTYVNGRELETSHIALSQDLVAVGTTSFLLMDKEQSRETIFSPTQSPMVSAEKEEEETQDKSQEEEKKSWKDLTIPTRHLILAGTFSILLLIGIFSTISLFKSTPIAALKIDNEALLKETLKKFPGVEYSFNDSMGKIFLVGDVLTEIEKQELLYSLKGLTFIQSFEDNVVVDEVVWGDMNAFISKNPNWRSVTMTATTPGKFIIKGYVQTLQDAASLMEFVALNFPYNEKLESQVVVANNLEIEVQTLLTDKGFMNVSFELTAGELVLSGRVNDKSEADFQSVIKDLKKISGIRSVKNFVIVTTASTSRINLSEKYKVTGTTKIGSVNQFVVINGQILAAGDALDGMTITQIEQDTVFLEKDGLKYRINYNQQ